MKNLLKFIVLSLITIGFFWGFANYGVPRIEPAAPPSTEKLDLGSMTMEQFIAVGDKLYNGKGTCTLCHNSLGRAPMLNNIGSVASAPNVLPIRVTRAKPKTSKVIYTSP